MTAADTAPAYDEAVASFLEYTAGASSTQRARRLALSDWAEFLDQTGRGWRDVSPETLFDELRDHGERSEWSLGKTGRTLSAVRGFYEHVELDLETPGEAEPDAPDVAEPGDGSGPMADLGAGRSIDEHSDRRRRAQVLRNTLREIVERRRHVRRAAGTS